MNVVSPGELNIISNLDADANRDLGSTVTTGDLYAGFTIRLDTLPGTTGDYFAHFKGSATGDFFGRVFAVGDGSGQFQLGVTTNTGSGPTLHPTKLDLNTTHQVVVKYTLGSTSTTIWVDPASEADTNATHSTATTGASSLFEYAFRQPNRNTSGTTSIGNIFVDDLRVARTFVEVVTVDFSLASNAAQSAPPGVEVAVAAFNVASLSADATMTDMTVTAAGTGVDDTEITNVRLFEDDGDGVFSATGDTALTSGDVFGGNNASLTLTPTTPFGITGGTSSTLFVAYSLAVGATNAATFSLSFDSATVTGATAEGLPLVSPTTTIDTTLTPVTFALVSVNDQTVNVGSQRVPIAAFDVSSSTGTSVLDSLSIRTLGTGGHAGSVTEVALFDDTNRNDTFDVGTDTLIVASVPTDGVFQLRPSGGHAITTGTTRRFLTYSFGLSGGDNTTFAVSIEAAAITAGFAQGLPVGSATLTVNNPLQGVRTSSSGSSGCRTTPESRRDSAALLLTWLLGLLGIVYWRRAR
jgi:hypothetical protein